MTGLNATHDAARRSWVASANEDSDFPVQNLPFGRFRRPGDQPRCGVAIGDGIVDLTAAAALGLIRGNAAEAAAGDDLLPLMRLGTAAASDLRAQLFDLLAEGGDGRLRSQVDQLIVAQADVELLLPTTPRQFSDMCVSTYHIGRRRGLDADGQPICPPMFRTLPVGYDGRASSVVVSGTPIVRPNGQWQERLDGGDLCFGPEPRQDYELEMGLWLGGPGNPLGQPMSAGQARAAMFGLALLNDWSARGLQLWEAMLGPFLGKSLATTLSPWIVTTEALAPFRIGAFSRPPSDPPLPPHLHNLEDQVSGGFDIELSAHLVTPLMDGQGEEICRTNFRHMYWTFTQMVVHHASNGCSLAAGDLLGSGTCSGPDLSEAACLMEATMTAPLTLGSGETRRWLLDGDTVILRGRAHRQGFVAIGFGEARGTIIAAPDWGVPGT